MKPSHIVMLLAVGLLCAATLTEAKPGREKDRQGRGRGGSRRGPPRRPRKVLACSVSPGTDVADCGESSSCNAGPIDVVFNEEDVAVKFCDRPYKPKREDVCKITDAEGNEIEACRELKECADGETCIVGPIESQKHRRHNLYLCGTENVLPTVNYAEILKEKACGVGTELDEDACGDRGSCASPKVTVDGDILTFCVRDDDETDDDRTLLDLLNHARRGKKGSSEEDEDDAEEDDEDNDDDCDDRRRSSDESEGSEGEGTGGRGGGGSRRRPSRGRPGGERPGE